MWNQWRKPFVISVRQPASGLDEKPNKHYDYARDFDLILTSANVTITRTQPNGIVQWILCQWFRLAQCCWIHNKVYLAGIEIWSLVTKAITTSKPIYDIRKGNEKHQSLTNNESLRVRNVFEDSFVINTSRLVRWTQHLQHIAREYSDQ